MKAEGLCMISFLFGTAQLSVKSFRFLFPWKRKHGFPLSWLDANKPLEKLQEYHSTVSQEFPELDASMIYERALNGRSNLHARSGPQFLPRLCKLHASGGI
eukprot:TRINITY_DN39754_c0_g1_i1.p1 TRINITY_DN39754_c0_g1~~TRINITY_DN39754_c0_g1_i1.p1  ORF type:complete len:101 (-),score=8.45 TRINITY_DN39754_c0_g1_i1:373-675(-)